ncbi:MAG: hypothetical protein JO264_12350 [Acidisphaera sp.]|nr:hypothetical protein [Acidisphaera sp.]
MGRQATRRLLLATTVMAGLLSGGASAEAQQSDQRLNAIEAQIKSLQDELQRVRRDLRAAQLRSAQFRATQEAARANAAAGSVQPTTAAPAPPAQPAPPPATLQAAAPNAPASAPPQPGAPPEPLGSFRVGGVTVQLGGFIEAAGIFRTRNEVADIASSFSGIPEGNSVLAHENEFRASARQSRLSLLVQGEPSPEQRLAAYFETDFQGTGPSSNSNESNSYNLRLRQAYATYDNTDWGLRVLGGQAWSLLTMNKSGMTPRQENIPLTIDAQYVVGFDWTRQAQIRVAKEFDDHRLWLAASLEEPQAVFYVGPNGAGTVGGTANINNPGGSGLNSSNNYSDDVAPDIILKAAYDPGFGHYEVYGLARFLHDRVDAVGSGSSNTRLAGGGGAGAILPVIPQALDIQASFLGGYGIGRYGSGQLPDATLAASGRPVPLPEIEALVGLVGHPVPEVDLYGYVGTEQILGRSSFAASGKGYGYGSPLYNNSGCGVELSTAGCTANTSGLIEGTIGGWYRFLHGSYGTMQVGAQYAYVRRDIFSGVGGGKATDDNIALLSFRYAPFQ